MVALGVEGEALEDEEAVAEVAVAFEEAGRWSRRLAGVLLSSIPESLYMYLLLWLRSSPDQNQHASKNAHLRYHT